MMITLYKGLILSRGLYMLPLFKLSRNHWAQLETVQRLGPRRTANRERDEHSL